MPTPELRTVGKGMRLNAAEVKSKRKTRTKRKNTVNAVIHENDLQNGTEKEIKLWAWLGNPWILSGRNDRSSEGDSLIPKKKTSTEGGVTAWKASARITIRSGVTRRFTFPPHVVIDLEMIWNASRPECDRYMFVSAQEHGAAMTAAPALTNQDRPRLYGSADAIWQ